LEINRTRGHVYLFTTANIVVNYTSMIGLTSGCPFRATIAYFWMLFTHYNTNVLTQQSSLYGY